MSGDYITRLDIYRGNGFNNLNTVRTGYGNKNYTDEVVLNFNKRKTESVQKDVKNLREEFNNVKEEQGVLGKLWNGIKNITGIGLGSKKVEAAIKDYENGKISYEEALGKIDSYKQKQKDGVNIVTNVIAGAATVCITVGTGGFGLGAGLAAGAAIGGVTKAGLKTADRATNEVEGDAVDAKQIAKDVITGAVDGAVNIATMGMAGKAASTVGKSILNGAVSGAKAGAISGAAAGATEYSVDSVFDNGKKFTIKGLFSSTASNAVAGGLMGGVLGGITGGIEYKNTPKPSVKAIDSVEEASDNVRLIIKRNEKIGIPVDNQAQAVSYIDNYNINNKSKAITDSVIRSNKEEVFTDLSKKSETLAEIFDSQIETAAKQIDNAFADNTDIKLITARPKEQKSIFSKLAKKDLDDNLKAYDIDTCYDTIEDALGTRIQIKGLTQDSAKDTVNQMLSDTNLSYDDFVKYLRNETDFDLSTRKILEERKFDILETLKAKQTQSTVNQIVEGIKTGKLTITEINNYGDELTSYFTASQIAQIADAYDYAVFYGFIKSDKAFEITTLHDEIFKNSNSRFDIDSEKTIFEITSKYNTNAKYTVIQSKKAVKPSGYSSSQMNTKHKFDGGKIGNGELQIRGSQVNDFADVEHIPYDIRKGKITKDDTKYSGIYNIIKRMSKKNYNGYNQYLSDVYKTLRMKELGLLDESTLLPSLSDYIIDLPKSTLDLIDANGLSIFVHK